MKFFIISNMAMQVKPDGTTFIYHSASYAWGLSVREVEKEAVYQLFQLKPPTEWWRSHSVFVGEVDLNALRDLIEGIV